MADRRTAVRRGRGGRVAQAAHQRGVGVMRRFRHALDARALQRAGAAAVAGRAAAGEAPVRALLRRLPRGGAGRAGRVVRRRAAISSTRSADGSRAPAAFRTFAAQHDRLARRDHVSVRGRAAGPSSSEGGFEEMVLHLDGRKDARRRFPSRSSPTAPPEGPHPRAPALLQRPAADAAVTRAAHRCCSPIPSCAIPDVLGRAPARAGGGRRRRRRRDVRSRRLCPRARRQPSTSAPTALHAFYGRMFANGGGIAQERCALIDDGAPARWSTTWCAGGHAVAAAGRGRRLRPRSERQARRGPRL